MSEVLLNLYQNTLASGYTSGGSSISVTSVSSNITGGDSLPSSGSYSVTILDQNTGNPKAVFNVTARSGTTLTTTAEIDANCSAGDIVIGTVYTKRSLPAIVNTLNPFFQPINPPIAANFSNVNFNTGSGVTTTSADNTSPTSSITLCQNDPNNTLEIAAIAKSKINSLFTVTIGITFHSNTGASLIGLWLSDGTNNAFFGVNTSSPGGLLATFFSNYSGSFVANDIGVANCQPFGPLLWLRVQETSSNRLYFLSPDGINFFQVGSTSNTNHFTTSKYGFGIDNRNAGLGMVTCYSFTETTP